MDDLIKMNAVIGKFESRKDELRLAGYMKNGIETLNHEFIRYIIPKGITFDTLNKNIR